MMIDKMISTVTGASLVPYACLKLLYFSHFNNSAVKLLCTQSLSLVPFYLNTKNHLPGKKCLDK